MVKVGERTGPSTPSARQAPRIRVVLPVPSSPLTRTTSPGPSPAAIRSPSASVSAALEVLPETGGSFRSPLASAKEAELIRLPITLRSDRLRSLGQGLLQER